MFELLFVVYVLGAIYWTVSGFNYERQIRLSGIFKSLAIAIWSGLLWPVWVLLVKLIKG